MAETAAVSSFSESVAKLRQAVVELHEQVLRRVAVEPTSSGTALWEQFLEKYRVILREIHQLHTQQLQKLTPLVLVPNDVWVCFSSTNGKSFPDLLDTHLNKTVADEDRAIRKRARDAAIDDSSLSHYNTMCTDLEAELRKAVAEKALSRSRVKKAKRNIDDQHSVVGGAADETASTTSSTHDTTTASNNIILEGLKTNHEIHTFLKAKAPMFCLMLQHQLPNQSNRASFFESITARNALILARMEEGVASMVVGELRRQYDDPSASTATEQQLFQNAMDHVAKPPPKSPMNTLFLHSLSGGTIAKEIFHQPRKQPQQPAAGVKPAMPVGVTPQQLNTVPPQTFSSAARGPAGMAFRT